MWDTYTGSAAEAFVKPAQYASVLPVTIHPPFRLYPDENETVLAMEAVAESIVTAAHDASFACIANHIPVGSVFTFAAG